MKPQARFVLVLSLMICFAAGTARVSAAGHETGSGDPTLYGTGQLAITTVLNSADAYGNPNFSRIESVDLQDNGDRIWREATVVLSLKESKEIEDESGLSIIKVSRCNVVANLSRTLDGPESGTFKIESIVKNCAPLRN